MRPADVLQRHIDLRAAFDSTAIHTMIASMCESDNQLTLSVGYDIAKTIKAHLKLARTYVVSSAMNDEIINVAETEIDESSRFGENASPPSEFGFLVFERAIEVKDIRGRNMLIHAITWGVITDTNGKPGMIIMTLNDVSREPDEIVRDLGGSVNMIDIVNKMCCGWSVVGIGIIGLASGIGPRQLHPEPEKANEVLADGDTPNYEGILNTSYVILATWKLMGETIEYGSVTLERPPRATARRATRAGVTPEISVIMLRHVRRRTKNPGTGKPLEWKQTIPGHWRMQAWGPRRTLRRRIWIDEFEQGPDDAPRRPVKPKVTRLTR